MKSSFTLKLPHLLKKGPICKVILRPSDPAVAELKAKKQKIPSITVSALIDTGGSATAISQQVIRQLKLVPRGTVQVYTSHKNAEIRNEYDISLRFAARFKVNAYVSVLRVMEANFQDDRMECLIGRDVLQFARLIYDGKRREVTLSLA